MLIRSIPTSLTGLKEKHDAELKEQLENLRKKFKIRDFKLEDVLNTDKKPPKRSKSAELARTNRIAKNKKIITPRSASAEPKSNLKSTKSDSKSDIDNIGKSNSVNIKDVLKKNLEKGSTGSLDKMRQQSPTPSILKTSSSPRTRNDMMRKSVKFNENTENSRQAAAQKEAEQQKTSAPKIEMSLNWLMSVSYGEQNAIRAIKTIENFDKTIKNIDNKLLAKYDASLNPNIKKLSKTKSVDSDRERDAADAKAHMDASFEDTDKANENYIYVFECKKWLARDQGDKKIERKIKVTNMLKAK